VQSWQQADGCDTGPEELSRGAQSTFEVRSRAFESVVFFFCTFTVTCYYIKCIVVCCVESLQQRAMKIIFPAVKTIRCRWSLLMLTPLGHGVSSWLSGSLDGVSYVNCPAYITCFRTSGTLLSQTDYATQKHSSHCWWKLRNFAIHLYHTVSNIMISTAVANYVLHTNCCRRHWTLALS